MEAVGSSETLVPLTLTRVCNFYVHQLENTRYCKMRALVGVRLHGLCYKHKACFVRSGESNVCVCVW